MRTQNRSANNLREATQSATVDSSFSEATVVKDASKFMVEGSLPSDRGRFPIIKREIKTVEQKNTERKKPLLKRIAESTFSALNSPNAKPIAFVGCCMLESWYFISRYNREGLLAEHVGDVPVLGGVIIGVEILRRFPEKIKKFAGEISFLGASTWIALGESVLPQIFPGTADPRDIPVGILGATLGYVFAREGIKKGYDSLLPSIAPKSLR